MDSGQKPIEAFSSLELDRYAGEMSDFNDEAKELTENQRLEEEAHHIDFVVNGILVRYLNSGILEKDTILINAKFKRSAQMVATRFRLNLATHPDFPENEVLIVAKNEIEMAITSRIVKTKGYTPDTLISRIEVH